MDGNAISISLNPNRKYFIWRAVTTRSTHQSRKLPSSKVLQSGLTLGVRIITLSCMFFALLDGWENPVLWLVSVDGLVVVMERNGKSNRKVGIRHGRSHQPTDTPKDKPKNRTIDTGNDDESHHMMTRKSEPVLYEKGGGACPTACFCQDSSMKSVNEIPLLRVEIPSSETLTLLASTRSHRPGNPSSPHRTTLENHKRPSR